MIESSTSMHLQETKQWSKYFPRVDQLLAPLYWADLLLHVHLHPDYYCCYYYYPDHYFRHRHHFHPRHHHLAMVQRNKRLFSTDLLRCHFLHWLSIGRARDYTYNTTPSDKNQKQNINRLEFGEISTGGCIGWFRNCINWRN